MNFRQLGLLLKELKPLETTDVLDKKIKALS